MVTVSLLELITLEQSVYQVVELDGLCVVEVGLNRHHLLEIAVRLSSTYLRSTAHHDSHGGKHRCCFLLAAWNKDRSRIVRERWIMLLQLLKLRLQLLRHLLMMHLERQLLHLVRHLVRQLLNVQLLRLLLLIGTCRCILHVLIPIGTIVTLIEAIIVIWSSLVVVVVVRVLLLWTSSILAVLLVVPLLVGVLLLLPLLAHTSIVVVVEGSLIRVLVGAKAKQCSEGVEDARDVSVDCSERADTEEVSLTLEVTSLLVVLFKLLDLSDLTRLEEIDAQQFPVEVCTVGHFLGSSCSLTIAKTHKSSACWCDLDRLYISKCSEIES